MKKVIQWAVIGAAVITIANFVPDITRYVKMKRM